MNGFLRRARLLCRPSLCRPSLCRPSLCRPSLCRPSLCRPRARLGPRLAFALGLSLFAFGCVEPDVGEAGSDASERVQRLVIDADESVALEAGAGVGVAIEYARGGKWRLTTVCDTDLTGDSCVFDLLVSNDESDAGILAFEGVDLEAGDTVWAPDRHAVQLDWVTEADRDTLELTTEPGATVRISALLYDPDVDSRFDWSDDPRMISWVGDGAVQLGAPSNPVDLTPDRP